MGGGELAMEKFVSSFVWEFISLREFKDSVIDYLVNYYSGGEMDAEELRKYGKAFKLLGEEILNDLK